MSERVRGEFPDGRVAPTTPLKPLMPARWPTDELIDVASYWPESSLRLCHHPDQQETVQPNGRVFVTCPSCPAEASYDPAYGRLIGKMTPWALDG